MSSESQGKVIQLGNNLSQKQIDRIVRGQENLKLALDSLKKLEKEQTRIASRLESANEKAEDALEQYNKNIKVIKDKNNEITKYYEKNFIPVKAKFDDSDRGVKAVLEEAKHLNKLLSIENKEFEKSKSQIAELVDNLEANLEYSHNIIVDIEDDKKKLSEDLGTTKRLRLEVENATLESHRHLDIAADNRQKIEDAYNIITEISQEVEKLKAEAILTNEKISQYYEIATNKSIAGAFDNEKTNLNEQLAHWHDSLLNTTRLLAFVVFLIFFVQLWLNNWSLTNLTYDFYLRFLLTAPLVYYLYFCAKQYSLTRMSLEKYSFKTTLALSIEAHTELLNKNFGEQEQDEILDFSLSCLRKIYNEPYLDDKQKVQLELAQQAKGKGLKGTAKGSKGQANSEIVAVITKALDLAKKIKP